ncbi:uncharacterized protein V1518DRAFT_378936, partial [Limtongia smithiae]|uniref:uncharacterized protein n=1 Tax=Limtongia smithiae TaxID=1125753 RepID=UPI0034CEBF51
EEKIIQITEKGIKTSQRDIELDIIVFATGFDAISGGLTQIDIMGTNGVTLKEYWSDGIYTNLGLTSNGFPNMFFVYGPQSPTTFCNGPSCCQLECDWINSAIAYCKEHNYTRMQPTHESEVKYKEEIDDMADKSLLKGTTSFFMGANIPGKKIESLNYLGGVPSYYKKLKLSIAGDFKDFEFE